MLTTLLEHARRTNLEEMLSKSYVNCHAMGVHSLMLIDHPGQRVRMFYADTGHDLSNNHPECESFTVALHPHHCDITLVPVFGVIKQITLHSAPGGSRVGRKLRAYRYQSAITDGHGSFTEVDAPPVVGYLQSKTMTHPMFMRASEAHTMAVRSQAAAWFVLEGPDDPEYDAVCYNTVMPKIDDAMYAPMTEQYLSYIVDELRRRGVQVC